MKKALNLFFWKNFA